jgi:hypothetical protein
MCNLCDGFDVNVKWGPVFADIYVLSSVRI